jgi:hypothetical protein
MDGPSEREAGYEAIRRLARDTGRHVKDLLALAQWADPFYAGSPTQRAHAEWFVGVWERLGFTRGVHLKLVHYRFVSLPDRGHHDGRPYENTEADLRYLNNASEFARYLGLIDPDAIVDHRNPEPRLYGPGALLEPGRGSEVA